jgi:hypothetical protein
VGDLRPVRHPSCIDARHPESARARAPVDKGELTIVEIVNGIQGWA